MATSELAPVSYHSASRPGPLSLIRKGVEDVWSRRRLARYLVRAELIKTGADTLLGNVWWVLDPLLQMVVYVVLISIILGQRTPDYPLFIFSAILPWKWFSTSINEGLTSVVSRERIIKQVQFPKIVLPVAATMSGVAHFAFGLVPLAFLMLVFYRDRISWTLVLLPVIAVVQLTFTLVLTVSMSAVNVFFRDLGNLARHVLRLWFYLSPALYGAAAVEKLSESHSALGTLLMLNPWAVLFEAYRDVIYGATVPDGGPLAALWIISIGLLAVAVWFFKRMEPAFAKVL